MLREIDRVRGILWSVIVVTMGWALFFVPDGPQYVVNGIRYGSILMLGAIGLSLTYKILNFANFSHGEFIVIGAFVTYAIHGPLLEALPQWFPALLNLIGDEYMRYLAVGIGLFFSVVVASLVAMGIDRVLYRRMRKSAAVVLIIASFGMSLFLRSIVQAIWGTGNKAYAVLIKPGTLFDFELFRIRMSTLEIATVTIALLLIVLLHLFLKYTRTGKAMRAMSDNVDLARISGVNTERMIAWTWGIGAGLAAIAGVFMGLNFGAFNPNTGGLVLLSLFAAVILGGIGSPYGAMLGGLIIGVAQNILVAPATSISSQYQPAVAFSLMIAMLLIRPQGLLGEAERRG
ncbi:branched-chain amino acid ABC transporter permease [Candidatus Acetothermia bacterium]|jgi:branched-chain amino acid transport system permease protein/neutral amino acid transport system permease protein|nr:branched-chain amino acid ABC transporter permease [Candidatus Acetothermia bacterium]MCI2431682.1 branched-chain amino acid ABC transporter permease [Candidatus Acetothermia bacterium]MCI2436398.1 branched-chain amino acid ABC transporter permease [Candidatus Acetothermia bacterium]